MGKYTPDGGVVSSKTPVSPRDDTSDHRSMFGLYRGIVVRSIYPDEKESSGKSRMEYLVRVRGQEYPNAINLREAGGIYNYQERVRKGIEKSFTGTLDDTQFTENLDGEIVYVMFIEGNGDVPLIVGGETHPRHSAYTKIKKEDGLVDVEEFNGVEMKIDKDSNFSITQVGRKDKDGKILNEDATKSVIKIFGETGDIEINTHGTEGTADLRIRLNKKDKKLEMYASDNKIVAGADGIKITDKGGDVIDMKNGSVEMTIKGGFKLNADDTAEFKGTGGTNVGDSSSSTNVLGSAVALAGGGVPVARLGDMVVGTGNLGAPVVSQILQGSSKVTTG